MTDKTNLEARLRLDAEALKLAPSGRAVGGPFHASKWLEHEESKREMLLVACAVLEALPANEIGDDLATRIANEASAMRAATDGVHTPDTFHLVNWNDKPHRLLYNAANLMIEAADAVAEKTNA